MQMRIVVPEAANTGALAQRLTAVFGRRRVASLPAGHEVDVRVEGASDRAVLRVVDTVESWLDQAGIGPAEMWLGEHAYKVARWVRSEAQSFAADAMTTRIKEH
jgi:hypothetical protein